MTKQVLNGLRGEGIRRALPCGSEVSDVIEIGGRKVELVRAELLVTDDWLLVWKNETSYIHDNINISIYRY